jgi:hypothetical protein
MILKTIWPNSPLALWAGDSNLWSETAAILLVIIQDRTAKHPTTFVTRYIRNASFRSMLTRVLLVTV